MVILGTMIHGTMTTSSKKDYLSILGLSPDFEDYLDSLFGYEYSPNNSNEYENEPYED